MNVEQFKKIFGKNLKEIRRNHKLTQVKAAEAIGLEAHNWNRFENGKSFPKLQTLVNIINYFKVSPSEFFIQNKIDLKQEKNIVEILNKNPERVNEFFKILKAITEK